MWSGHSICMHIGAEEGSNWFSRRFATFCFNATFQYFNCNRATALVRKSNVKAQKFVLKLGFIEEDDLISMINNRPSSTDIIITGPSIPPKVIEMADQITELRCN